MTRMEIDHDMTVNDRRETALDLAPLAVMDTDVLAECKTRMEKSTRGIVKYVRYAGLASRHDGYYERKSGFSLR